jgi:hypothetical protein
VAASSEVLKKTTLRGRRGHLSYSSRTRSGLSAKENYKAINK